MRTTVPSVDRVELLIYAERLNEVSQRRARKCRGESVRRRVLSPLAVHGTALQLLQNGPRVSSVIEREWVSDCKR